MSGLQAAVNFIIVLLLCAFIICFLLLIQMHASAYFRKKRQMRGKALFYALIERYMASENVLSDVAEYKCKTGVAVLSQILEECEAPIQQTIQQMVREAGFEAYIKKQLESGDIAYCTMIIKLVGELRLLGFSDYIVGFLYKYKTNVELQYVGFLTLSLLGEGDSLTPICMDTTFIQALSFRSLKEIFKHFQGDKVALCGALLDAPDHYIRRIAVIMAGDEKLAPLARRVMEQLHSDNMNIVIDAIRSLGHLQYEQAVTVLRQFTGHPRWEVRNATIQALANIGIEKYAWDVARGLSDREWWVRYNAAAALACYSHVRELQQMPAVQQDRFASEILQYAIARRALQREVYVI